MLRDLRWFDSLSKRDLENGSVINEIRDVFKAVTIIMENRKPCKSYIDGTCKITSPCKHDGLTCFEPFNKE